LSFANCCLLLNDSTTRPLLTTGQLLTRMDAKMKLTDRSGHTIDIGAVGVGSPESNRSYSDPVSAANPEAPRFSIGSRPGRSLQRGRHERLRERATSRNGSGTCLSPSGDFPPSAGHRERNERARGGGRSGLLADVRAADS
jgi:hypothetical protein